MSFDHTIKKGTTNKQVEVVLRNSTTGQGLTGVLHSSVTANYWREGAGSGSAITMQSGTLGLYLSGSWIQVDATNMPGVYQFSIPDAALATGVDAVTISFTVAGAIDKVIRISLLDVDLRDATDMGVTNLHTIAEISDGVWDELQSGHVTAGTFGAYLDAAVSTAGGGATASECADAVWDELRSGHVVSGSFGEYVLSNLVAVNGDTAGATGLGLSVGEIVNCSVDTVVNGHTPTTSEFQSDSLTELTDDHYNGRSIIFTSGNLSGQATAIQNYTNVGGIGQLSVVALTEAPANDDTFIIL